MDILNFILSKPQETFICGECLGLGRNALTGAECLVCFQYGTVSEKQYAINFD